MTGTGLHNELVHQEPRLAFGCFDDDTAWALGVALRDAAPAASLPVAISIRRHGQRLFHTALPGASADNDGWLERLDPSDYAAHGGAFPILVRGSDCVGTVDDLVGHDDADVVAAGRL